MSTKSTTQSVAQKLANCRADYETQLDERLDGKRPRNFRDTVPMRDSPSMDPSRDKKDADKQYSASGKQQA